MESIEEGEASEMPGHKNAQQELAELASSLMVAAAEQAQNHEEENSSGAEPMPTKPLVKKARKLLFRRLRVGMEDSRVFIGKFHCLDKQGNIVLYNTVEYRRLSPPLSGDDGKSSGCSGAVDVDVALIDGATTEQRNLGLVLIPARCRTSCHVECSLQEQFSLLSV